MKIIIGFFIFCLVLFIYLHIQFHLKTGEDLEMYEIEQPSKDKLEEICDLRQPAIFDFDCEKIMNGTSDDNELNNDWIHNGINHKYEFKGNFSIDKYNVNNFCCLIKNHNHIITSLVTIVISYDYKCPDANMIKSIEYVSTNKLSNMLEYTYMHVTTIMNNYIETIQTVYQIYHIL
jgi:hypothetical protein